jgi:hypothetical protein
MTRFLLEGPTAAALLALGIALMLIGFERRNRQLTETTFRPSIRRLTGLLLHGGTALVLGVSVGRFVLL